MYVLVFLRQQVSIIKENTLVSSCLNVWESDILTPGSRVKKVCSSAPHTTPNSSYHQGHWEVLCVGHTLVYGLGYSLSGWHFNGSACLYTASLGNVVFSPRLLWKVTGLTGHCALQLRFREDSLGKLSRLVRICSCSPSFFLLGCSLCGRALACHWLVLLSEMQVGFWELYLSLLLSCTANHCLVWVTVLWGHLAWLLGALGCSRRLGPNQQRNTPPLSLVLLARSPRNTHLEAWLGRSECPGQTLS